MKKFFDTGTLLVVMTTLILFILALFTKGLTHDILLEAGVFLISVKLIMMAYKTNIFYQDISQNLTRIHEQLKNLPDS
ncbi:MAG TPA: hypothetical protein PLV06_07950 [Bacteroidales bacterium]|nr:hypothetical protein [Bacteroidales bacterium]HPJ60459.1 hypothetical protein [Bacteroidales bacterium]HPR12300.1 hypothetical protein [Bacteroidales bacterium]HRW83848.1 hypothetical protein [Bacteroidales bacterium]